MLDVVLFFLGASLVLYAVFGGADFGAGILELLAPPGRRAAQERLITRALGPVWEANHVWLIVAVVVLFNGFPRAFQHVSVVYHLPLTALLLVVILRGCAFTFRHYDAGGDGGPEPRALRVYTAVFRGASAAAPLILGLMAGGVLLGRPAGEGSYAERYVAPWLSLFGAVLGLFLAALFVFVAAAFLVGETRAEERELRDALVRRVQHANAAAVVLGALVFPAAAFSGVDLVGRLFERPLALGAMLAATVLLWPMHRALHRGRSPMALRVLAAAIFGAVLLGWFALQYPYVIPGPLGGLTAVAAAAPAPSLKVLGIALIAGSALMFPALGYLFWVFKRPESPRTPEPP